MASSLPPSWTLLDQFIEYLRFRRVLPLLTPGCELVDLGCGDGAFLRKSMMIASRGVGLDANAADSGIGNNFRILGADLGKPFPLENGTADVVTALAVMEHLSDPQRAVSEAHRILRTGGIFILTTPSRKAKPLLEFLAFNLKIISREDILDHKHYHSKEDLLCLFSCFENVRYQVFQFGFNQLIVGKK